MKTKKIKLLLFATILSGSLLFMNNVSAYANAAVRHDTPPEVDTTGNIIHIPIWIEHDAIFVIAEINGVTRTFLFDSGAPCLLLNSVHFESQIDPSQTKTASIGIDESTGDFHEILFSTFDFQGICMDNQYAPAVDLSHLEKEFNMEIYGLIGANIISDYDVLLDYQNLMITLINPAMSGEYLEKNYKDSQLEINTIEMQQHIPTVDVKINGQSLKFGIDTGMSTNLLSTNILPAIEGHYSSNGSSNYYTANGSQASEIGVIDNLVIGNKHFLNARTIVHNFDQRLTEYSMKLDGFIGAPILSAQKTMIRYNDKQLIFID